MRFSEPHSTLDLASIVQLQEKPQPFEPGEPLFWTDPHIARQMLASHLDPTVDGASRRPETIERITNWITSSVGLRPGDWILDLGCGPGLYAERLAQAGVEVMETRISHLAYAPEIASAMLRRQQATAVVAARQKIVEGAVGMVEMALDLLSKSQRVTLDEERKAAMVSNLLVVLCGDREAQPVVNTGTLYQ